MRQKKGEMVKCGTIRLASDCSPGQRSVNGTALSHNILSNCILSYFFYIACMSSVTESLSPQNIANIVANSNSVCKYRGQMSFE